MSRKYVQTQSTYLEFGIGDSDTELILNSFLDLSGNQLTMANFGDIGYLTLGPKTPKEEIVSFTSITDRGDGTVTLGGLTRGLKSVEPYDATGTARSHGAFTKVVASNNPQLYAQFVNIYNDATLQGNYTFQNPITSVPAVNADHVPIKSQVLILTENGQTVTGNITFTGNNTITGQHDFTGGEILVPTATSNQQAVNLAQAQALATGTESIIGGIDNATITYDSQGRVATVVDDDFAITYTISYLDNGLVSSITDGTNTWTPTYDASFNITSITQS